MSSPDNWEQISEFMSDLRNASRLAAYVDTVVEVFESGAWRKYEDRAGTKYLWRENEFDYFLISCGADYADVQRLLAWDKARAVDLAQAMSGEDRRKRRSIEDVDKTWRSSTGATISQLAESNGWTSASGSPRPAPVPARARVRAQHGKSKDALAREAREAELPRQRKQELDKQAAALFQAANSSLEVRYLIDRLRDDLKTQKPSDG